MKGPTKIERISLKIDSTIGTHLHPNKTIVWNGCLMKVRLGLEEWEPEMHIDKELRALNTFFNIMLFSLKTETLHIKKCKKHKMHEDMTFNAWRVLQRSKELDQGPKEQ